jgi:hypothetical protein
VFPATGVEHALTCRFLSAATPSLLVAKANVLDVYYIQVRPRRPLSCAGPTWAPS